MNIFSVNPLLKNGFHKKWDFFSYAQINWHFHKVVPERFPHYSFLQDLSHISNKAHLSADTFQSASRVKMSNSFRYPVWQTNGIVLQVNFVYLVDSGSDRCAVHNLWPFLLLDYLRTSKTYRIWRMNGRFAVGSNLRWYFASKTAPVNYVALNHFIPQNSHSQINWDVLAALWMSSRIIHYADWRISQKTSKNLDLFPIFSMVYSIVQFSYLSHAFHKVPYYQSTPTSGRA